MTKKALVALGFAAAAVILLLLYFFHSGALRLKAPEPTGKPGVKSETAPGPKETAAPATAPTPEPAPAPALAPGAAPTPGLPPAATLPAPPQPLPPSPVPPEEKPLTKPEAPSPTPPKGELPTLEATEKHAVLAGSYRKYKDAAKQMEKLKKQGLPAFIRRDRGKFHVWAGPFSSRQEANAAAKAIKRKMKIRPKIQKIVIPIPK